MKAIFLNKVGDAHDAFEIREIEKPNPAAGEVRLKVLAFGLNFAEVMARQGLYRDAPQLPFVPGYDSVGIIDAIGEGVSDKWIGKRVMALSKFGSYAQYVVASLLTCAEMPSKMSDEEGTAIGVQYSTAYHMAIRMASLMEGEKVLIRAAAGGVGTALIQLCRDKGCEIYALAGNQEKIDKLKSEGIERAFNYKNLQDMRSLGGIRFDVIFNPVAGKSFKEDMKRLAPGGRLFLFGASSRSEKKAGKLADISLLFKMGILLPIFLVGKSQSVLGVNMLSLAKHNPKIIGSTMKALGELYEEGVIKPKIGRLYSAFDISEAHAYLESGKSTGKIVLRWDESS